MFVTIFKKDSTCCKRFAQHDHSTRLAARTNGFPQFSQLTLLLAGAKAAAEAVRERRTATFMVLICNKPFVWNCALQEGRKTVPGCVHAR
jgi:hypothetical protein